MSRFKIAPHAVALPLEGIRAVQKSLTLLGNDLEHDAACDPEAVRPDFRNKVDAIFSAIEALKKAEDFLNEI